MAISDLTGTKWKIDNLQSLANTSFDISFTAANQNYGFLYSTSESIFFDNTTAFGENITYTEVTSLVKLSSDTIANYSIKTNGTVDAQNHIITGNILIQGGTLENAEITGDVILTGSVIENCTINGNVIILDNADASIRNSVLKGKLNIINAQTATIALENATLVPESNSYGGLNIVNSNVNLANLSIDLSSSTNNRVIIKGNSQVIFNNTGINCQNPITQATNFIVEDSALLTIMGDNTWMAVDDISINILHTSSNNIIIQRGTFSFNPSNYSFITIPEDCEVHEVQQGDITLYRVVAKIIETDKYDINDEIVEEN